MLLTPTLALLTIVFNFCALLHVTNSRNGLSTRWNALDHVIYALEETTVTAYENYLDIVAPPPSTSSPVYSPALHRAEWVYRSSAVRILDLVDGSSKVQTVSSVDSPSLLPPSPLSPTKTADAGVPAGHLLPTLTSPIHPATFEQFPTYDPSVPSAITLSVAQSLGLIGSASLLVYTLIFAWLRDRRSRRGVYASKPTLTCDVNCRSPAEYFHTVRTVTSIPSYPGSEVKFAELGSEGSSGRSNQSHVNYPTVPRSFPVIITNADGRTLFNAEIKLSPNHVVTELSATTSTVSFSIDVVASLDVPTVPEWYVPAKDDAGVSAQADDSVFLLLVRGFSDCAPLAEESKDSDCASKPKEETLLVDQTPPSDAQTLVSDREVEDRGADVAPLGSPMCPITIPIHYRGFSSFETALINSSAMVDRANVHKENGSHLSKARTKTKPKDVPFAWLKDIYTCGDNHLDGCPCEEIFAEDVHNELDHPYHVMSKILYDHDAAPEFNQDTHSEERGSGMCDWAYTVSPGLPVPSEVSPTSTSDPAEPRLTARSDPLLADGKGPAGLDSTVALMPSFSVASPELAPRCRSSGISTPAEFSDGTFGKQSVSSDEDNMEMGSSGEYTGMTRFANGIRSPPSPVLPEQVNSLLDALGPVLVDYTPPPSVRKSASVHLYSNSNRFESTPLEYSPSSVRVDNPVKRPATPECDDWVGESTGTVDLESVLEVEP